jgi:hypothetical protein
MLGLTDFALIKFKYSTISHDVAGYSDQSLFKAMTGFTTVPSEYAILYGGREFKASANTFTTTGSWMSMGRPSLTNYRIDSIEKTTGSYLSAYQIGNSVSLAGNYGMGAVSVERIPATNGRLYQTEKAIIAGGIYVNPANGVETWTKVALQFRPSNGYWADAYYDDSEGEWVPASFYGAPYASLPSLNEYRFNPFVDECFYKTDPNSTTTWRNMYIVACGGSSSFEVLKSNRVYSITTNSEQQIETATPWLKVDMSASHLSGAMSISPDSERLVFFGGYDGEQIEAYYLQPSAGVNQYTISSSIGMVQPTGRWNFGSANDKSGRFWIAGGYAPGGTGTLRDDVWAFDYTANEWIEMPTLPVAIAGGKLVFSSNSGSDEVFFIGGHDSSFNAINGYTMKYLDVSPSWVPISSTMLSNRVGGHGVVSLGPVAGTYSTGSMTQNSGSLIVTGGKCFRKDQTSTIIPNALAITEIVKLSSSINFASAVSLVDEYALGYNTFVQAGYTSYKSMDVIITGSAKIFPLASVVISGWSGSNGSGSIDLVNSTTGSVFAPTDSFAIAQYSENGVRFIVPFGSIKNNTNVYLKPVSSSRPYLTSSNKINNIPSHLLSISPASINISSSASSLAPESSVTGTGNWMNYLSGVYFGNASVYGNNVYFTSSFSTGSDYYHLFRLPNSGSSITVNGEPVYLRANTLHDIYIKENNGNTTGSFKSYFRAGEVSTPLKWLSGPASGSENASTSKLMWFKLNETYSPVTESVTNNSWIDTSFISSSWGWLFPQQTGSQLTSARLLRAGSITDANPSTSKAITGSFTGSLRDWLGSGTYAVEFWYNSPVGIAAPTSQSTPAYITNVSASVSAAFVASWTNASYVTGSPDNTFAQSSIRGYEYVPAGIDGEGYPYPEEYYYWSANFTSSLPASLISAVPTGSTVSSIVVDMVYKTSGLGLSYVASILSGSSYLYSANVTELGSHSTAVTQSTTITTTGLKYGTLVSSPMSIRNYFLNNAVGSRTIYVDSIRVTANIDLPTTAGKFGQFAQGVTNNWVIAASSSLNTMNGYLLTVGKSPGPIYGCVGPVRNSSASGWTPSTNFTGTCAFYDSTTSTENWGNNCLLQIGFDANQKMFVMWDVGPHKNTGGVLSGSTPVGSAFTYSFPQTDNTWHHVCLNVNTGSLVTYGTASFRQRGNMDLYVDGVLVESRLPSGTMSTRNTLPQGANPSYSTFFTGTALGAFPPDYGFFNQTVDKPGQSGSVTLGPLRSVYIDDLVISSGTQSAYTILRNYQKGKGIVY